MPNISELSALELSQAYAAKTLSPNEVIQHQLECLERANHSYNLSYLSNPEQALSEAQASTERWFKGIQNSPLDGVPTTVKDGLLSKGEPTYRGSAANTSDDENWNVNCPIVARQREAGMISLAKTTMPDFGILASGYSSKHGITRNPWNPDYTPGGSSSGTAASIACGVNPMAVGTDIVGSIRLPASFTGLFGHKPSQGRVPYFPPSAPTLVAGPMSRTVADSALYMNLLSLPDGRDITALEYNNQNYLTALEQLLEPQTTGRRPRLGLLTDIGFGPKPEAAVVAAVTEAAQTFRDSGFDVELIDTPFSSDSYQPAELFYKQRCFTEFKNFDVSLQQQSPYIYDWCKDANEVSAPELYDAMNAIRDLRAKTMSMFIHIDYLLLPSTATTAFAAELPANDVNRLFDPWCNNFLFNITEQPGSSINCGYDEKDLPIGLQIIGQRFDDLGVLQLSRFYEKVRPLQRNFPII